MWSVVVVVNSLPTAYLYINTHSPAHTRVHCVVVVVAIGGMTDFLVCCVCLQQKTAVKKLENVKRDHLKRIDELQKKQVTSLLHFMVLYCKV